MSAHKNTQNTFKINVSYDFGTYNRSTDHDKNSRVGISVCFLAGKRYNLSRYLSDVFSTRQILDLEQGPVCCHATLSSHLLWSLDCVVLIGKKKSTAVLLKKYDRKIRLCFLVALIDQWQCSSVAADGHKRTSLLSFKNHLLWSGSGITSWPGDWQQLYPIFVTKLFLEANLTLFICFLFFLKKSISRWEKINCWYWMFPWLYLL